LVNRAKHNPEIFIRADGDASSGFGHLMRAISFAVHAASLTKVKLLTRNPDELAHKSCGSYGIYMQDISSISDREEAEFHVNYVCVTRAHQN